MAIAQDNLGDHDRSGDNDKTGRCQCGAVTFRLRGPLREVVVCHCRMCQRNHGQPAAFTAIAPAGLILERSDGLAWYRGSPLATRGFCNRCGASLFWRPEHGRHVAIAAGAIDPPTGLRCVAHIYVADQGDYYAISDELPRHRAGLDSPLVD